MPNTPTIRITSHKSDITPGALCALYISLEWMQQRDGAVEKTAAVIERSDGVVGAFSPEADLIGFVKILSDGSMYTCLAEIIVHPEWQGKGIGRLMMDRVREEWGHTPIFLETFTSNRGFFEKCGLVTRENMVVCSKWFDRAESKE